MTNNLPFSDLVLIIILSLLSLLSLLSHLSLSFLSSLSGTTPVGPTTVAVMEGEILRLRCRLTNEGAVALGDLQLTSNVCGMVFEVRAGRAARAARAFTHCIIHIQCSEISTLKHGLILVLNLRPEDLNTYTRTTPDT